MASIMDDHLQVMYMIYVQILTYSFSLILKNQHLILFSSEASQLVKYCYLSILVLNDRIKSACSLRQIGIHSGESERAELIDRQQDKQIDSKTAMQTDKLIDTQIARF